MLWCAVCAVGLPFDKAHWWQWAKHIPTPAPAVAAYLAVIAIASAWLLYRACRLAARFDDRGITVRKLLKTDQYGWPEVIRFADGWVRSGNEGSKDWAVRVVLGDGKAVTVKATSGNQSANFAAIRQVAARYRIPAELTGFPRNRDGSPAGEALYPDFNIADSCLTCGAALMLLLSLRSIPMTDESRDYAGSAPARRAHQ
jgi:hypothetical protein